MCVHPNSMEVVLNYFHNIPPRVLLKRVWIACAFLSLIYILIAIICGDDNHKSKYGTKAIGFTALWTAGMVLILMVSSGIVIFYGKAPPHIVGLIIGISGMLTQLLFVVMIVFFVYAEHAQSSGHDPQSSDRAMGSFALFLLIAMGLWTTVLWFCKDELISNRQSLSQTDTQPLQSAKNSTSFIPSAPPVKSTSTSINTHEELPLHQQDDVVDVDLDDDTEAF